jgi:hypothetical protein
MKIEFHRTGGFASPASDLNDFDDSALTGEERSEMMALVAAAAQDSGRASNAPQRPPTPDSMTYRVSIESGQHQLAFKGSMSEIPERARPLVRWLESRAKRKTSGK